MLWTFSCRDCNFSNIYSRTITSLRKTTDVGTASTSRISDESDEVVVLTNNNNESESNAESSCRSSSINSRSII